MNTRAKEVADAVDASRKQTILRGRGPCSIPEVRVDQIEHQLGLAVERVMAEGALYDPNIASWAIKQAQGDLIESVFLVRMFHNTLARWGDTQPVDTEKMQIIRRISGIFKDIPGGQILGPSFDSTHRILTFESHGDGPEIEPQPPCTSPETDESFRNDSLHASQRFQPFPRVTDILTSQKCLPRDPEPLIGEPVPDLTRTPQSTPADRAIRLQSLARGDEGFLLGCADSLQRKGGQGSQPFMAELRVGYVDVRITPPELGFKISIGKIKLTECVMVKRGRKVSSKKKAVLEKGYGLVFGQNQRKAISISLLDRSFEDEVVNDRSPIERESCPGCDQAFVLPHSDTVESSGFVQYLTFPQHVDFQAELAAMGFKAGHGISDVSGDPVS